MSSNQPVVKMSIPATRCECCGGVVLGAQWPIIDLASRTLSFEGRSVVATRSFQQLTLFEVLRRRAPNPVNIDALITMLWGCDNPLENERKSLHVEVCHLRRLLRELTDKIQVVTIPDIGYALRRVR